MSNDDWLMRQVNSFAGALAEAITGKAEEVEEVDLDFDHLFGAPPGLLASMSEGALLAMVRTADGLDPTRALALGVGLARDEAGRDKALGVLSAAVEASPGLRTRELEALLEALAQDPPLH